jgi:hypothetical protein
MPVELTPTKDLTSLLLAFRQKTSENNYKLLLAGKIVLSENGFSVVRDYIYEKKRSVVTYHFKLVN